MSIKVIFISGNIGAGKETILRYLHESLTNRNIKVKTILEPVELWRESGMLRRLYKRRVFGVPKIRYNISN